MNTNNLRSVFLEIESPGYYIIRSIYGPDKLNSIFNKFSIADVISVNEDDFYYEY